MLLKNFKTISLLAAVTLTLLLGYQNCGPELGATDGNSASGGSPFGYSATFDRIAYMSCPAATTSQDYFTLRAGAFDTNTSGIQLSVDFRNSVGSYPANRKIEILNQDAYNRDAQLILGLRPFDDLKTAVTVNGQPAVRNLLTPLNLSPIVQDLVNLSGGQFLPDSKFPLKGNLQLGISNDQAFRDSMTQRTFVLALTYLEAGQRFASRMMGDKVPGSAYHTQFDCGPTPANMHVLCAIEDYELLSGRTGGSWDCNDNYHFKIVRPGEAATAGCNFGSPQTTNPIFIEARKILGPNWAIDVNGGCIQNNSGACYAPGTSTVDYNSGANCDQTGQPACARHFSLCIKDL